MLSNDKINLNLRENLSKTYALIFLNIKNKALF